MKLVLLVTLTTIAFVHTRRVRIIDGTFAELHEFPYQVSLQWNFNNGSRARHICSGSILNRNWILTAAHCKQTLSRDGWIEVVAGVNNVVNEEASAQRRNVSRFIQHEEYNASTFRNDIGVKVTLPLRTLEDCQVLGSEDRSQVCGGGYRNVSGCIADSGGPLTVVQDNGARCFATLRHNTVADLDARHPTAKVGRRVTVRYVRDQLETELTRVEHALQHAVFDATEAGGKAVVVRYDNARIETLEVEHNDGIGVEARARFHDEGQILRRAHMRTLLNGGRHGHKVPRLRNAKHHAFHAELRASREHFVELNAKKLGQLGRATNQIELVENLKVAVHSLEIVIEHDPAAVRFIPQPRQLSIRMARHAPVQDVIGHVLERVRGQGDLVPHQAPDVEQDPARNLQPSTVIVHLQQLLLFLLRYVHLLGGRDT
uniref:Uncharacterized protein n=1 Tax=Anopheles atroparvus TaxID=41427 RepID=A0A182J5J2_ANOAO